MLIRSTLTESSLSLFCLTTNGPTAVEQLLRTSSSDRTAPCRRGLVLCGRDNRQDFGLQSDYHLSTAGRGTTVVKGLQHGPQRAYSSVCTISTPKQPLQPIAKPNITTTGSHTNTPKIRKETPTCDVVPGAQRPPSTLLGAYRAPPSLCPLSGSPSAGAGWCSRCWPAATTSPALSHGRAKAEVGTLSAIIEPCSMKPAPGSAGRVHATRSPPRRQHMRATVAAEPACHATAS